MSSISEDALLKAKSSDFTNRAKEWTRDTINTYIENEQIFALEMLEDSSLYVFFNPVPAGAKFNNVPIFDHFIVAPDSPSYIDFLEVSGVTKPGQCKDFS